MDNSNLIWVDCEMTGLSLERDALVEIAVLATDSELNILGDGIEDAFDIGKIGFDPVRRRGRVVGVRPERPFGFRHHDLGLLELGPADPACREHGGRERHEDTALTECERPELL